MPNRRRPVRGDGVGREERHRPGLFAHWPPLLSPRVSRSASERAQRGDEQWWVRDGKAAEVEVVALVGGSFPEADLAFLNLHGHPSPPPPSSAVTHADSRLPSASPQSS